MRRACLFTIALFVGVTLAPSGTAATTVVYKLDSSWGTGLQAEMSIANPGPAINNWSLAFNYPFTITLIWDATISSHVGNHYVITGAGWNNNLATGGTISLGWIATEVGAVAGPTGCTVQGLPVVSTTCPATAGPPDTTPPTVPGNLQSSGQTTTTISLAWSPSTDSGSGVAGYRVLEGAQLLATVSTTQYTVTGLTQGTSYQFAVQAYDNAGNVSASATLTVSTQAVVSCSILPAAPGGFSASGVTSSTANLTWTASTPQANCTVTYKLTNNGTQIAAGVTGTSYPLTGLAPSTTYSLGLVAVNQFGSSAPTLVLVTTLQYVPPPPTAWPTHVFAPYIDMLAWPTPSLAAINTASRVKYYTLAFVVAGATCQAAWGGVIPLSEGFELTDIAQLRQAGGDVILSFGGEDGVELAQSCTSVASLQAQYQAVIDMYQATRIDFDIEGAAVADPASIDRRNKAIAGLQAAAQAANKPLIVQFTLPVMPWGLTADGVNLMSNAIGNGVNLGILNVMAMDYGASADPAQMGANAVAAMNATFTQMQTLYGSGKTAAQLREMEGVTPMIGMNDVSPEVFSLIDANTLLTAAQSDQIGLLAMWSMGRDQQCPSNNYVSPSCSGVTEAPYAFSFVWNVFTGH